MSQNIDDFNRACALILGKLYESFPVPVFIQVSRLDEGAVQPGEAEDRRFTRLRIYSATMDFLSDEGYLRFAETIGTQRDAFQDVVLSSKGSAHHGRQGGHQGGRGGRSSAGAEKFLSELFFDRRPWGIPSVPACPSLSPRQGSARPYW